METSPLWLIDGTTALSPASQLEAELVKDRWDARNIPGMKYPPHSNHYYVNFSLVPEAFRTGVKAYARFKFAEGRVAQTIDRAVYCIGTFLTFLVEQYPGSDTLHELSAQDVDLFIAILKAKAEAQKLKDTQQYLQHHMLYLEDFLCYLERSQNLIRPHESTARIIWPHHYPKGSHPKSGYVKYIPQVVLHQLDAALQHLPPAYIPIVILLRASGWRISDVLYLKLDTCLEQHDDKFCLIGDIQKTRTLGHKIPITREVAAIVLTQIAWVKQHYTPEENPKRWLFPASKSHPNSQRFLRRNPLGDRGVRYALNHLVEKYQIRDEKGEVFHFGPHAFRHTKGIELLNSGMSLVMVQQWMAHASPEMTLTYAKFLDETMRTQWEARVYTWKEFASDGRLECL